MLRRTLLLVALFSNEPTAAQTAKPPEIKFLSPAECATITKRSDNEFYVVGPVILGGMTIAKSTVTRNGISFNGVDPFDVINRSCFRGGPV
jgi:hypothetical protein